MIKKQKHEMCKTNVETSFYSVNICKHERENNMTRLWCKIMPRINVEHIEGNEGSYSYVYPFMDLAQINFYVCIE
jgi:hypothetical protein